MPPLQRQKLRLKRPSDRMVKGDSRTFVKVQTQPLHIQTTWWPRMCNPSTWEAEAGGLRVCCCLAWLHESEKKNPSLDGRSRLNVRHRESEQRLRSSQWGWGETVVCSKPLATQWELKDDNPDQSRVWVAWRAQDRRGHGQ